MPLHKLAAPFIHTGTELLRNKVLVVHEDNGSIDQIINAEDAGDDVQKIEGLLCPGFVNAHCHLELSHLRNRIAEGTGMVEFLLQVIHQRQADSSLMVHYMQNADEQMLGNGIVAVGDVCNTSNSLAIKAESPLYYHNFVEAIGFLPANAKMRFDQALETARAFQQHFPPTQVSIVPHAPYSVSPKLFELIQNHEQQVTTMHNQESEAEAEFVTQGKGEMMRLFESIGVPITDLLPEGKTSLQYAAPYLPLARSILLVHNCYTSAADMQWLHDSFALIWKHFHFCICPKANIYIGNKLPDVKMLLEQHASLCLGTDSMASNDQLSILSEMQCLQSELPYLTTEQLLCFATANGAAALQVHDRFGEFRHGTTPGVLWLQDVGADLGLANASVQRLY